ncbi:MAG: DNA integrity scanning protein DisA nucleotide-binding domain protein [Acidimicrobiia bacterium]|nr:DNA integrity scanning protein DisA nucleotide-binding domain protein [Acidimicrobiia bacterium]
MIVEELGHARRPPVFETRRPMYGAFVVPPARSLVVGDELVELQPLDGLPLERARTFADGRSTFLVHHDDEHGRRRVALACFRRSVQYEYDLVEIQDATGAFIVQRTLLGAARLFSPEGVVDWNGREWGMRPNAGTLLPRLVKAVPTAKIDVLRGLLDLCIHWLSPGHVGATLVLRLGDRDVGGAGPQLDETAAYAGPSLSVASHHHHAAVFATLLQSDLATLVDADGAVVRFAVGLNASARADELITDPRGMRHRSARRFTYDDPSAVAFVVSEDGPVTVFSDGAPAAVCDLQWMRAETGEPIATEPRRCGRCEKMLVTVAVSPGRGGAGCPVCGNVVGLEDRKVVKVRKEWPVRGIAAAGSPGIKWPVDGPVGR